MLPVNAPALDGADVVVLPRDAEVESLVEELVSEMVRRRRADGRHAGDCVLVRIEFVGAGGLLELFDFEPVTRSTSSAALPCEPSAVCE
jgi:hypothetical protein